MYARALRASPWLLIMEIPLRWNVPESPEFWCYRKFLKNILEIYAAVKLATTRPKYIYTRLPERPTFAFGALRIHQERREGGRGGRARANASGAEISEQAHATNKIRVLFFVLR